MANWLITGLSRGLGLALAGAVLEAGDSVVGTVRGDTPATLAGRDRLHLIGADLADPAAPARVVQEAFDHAGRIDVIVNNAGYGLLGAVEQATDAELRHLFEVDVFAPVRLVRAALPFLREQGGGHIINITSIAGRAPTTGSALYAAAKHALEGFSAALAPEVAPFGIKVTAIAPGAFRTDFLSPHSIRWSAQEAEAYAGTIGRSSQVFSSMHGQQAGDPERAAQVILAVARAQAPPLHLLLGSDALGRARAKLGATAAEIDGWEAATLSTDHPS